VTPVFFKVVLKSILATSPLRATEPVTSFFKLIVTGFVNFSAVAAIGNLSFDSTGT